MLSKITLLHSSSICWTIIGATTHKLPLVCNCRANYELTVEIIVLGQCLANAARQNDALPTTPTITQRNWPNDCLLQCISICVKDHRRRNSRKGKRCVGSELSGMLQLTDYSLKFWT